MLETPVLSSSHYLNIFPLVLSQLIFGFILAFPFAKCKTSTYAPTWGLGGKLLGVMDNLVGRVNQQVTLLLNGTFVGEELRFLYCFALSANSKCLLKKALMLPPTPSSKELGESMDGASPFNNNNNKRGRRRLRQGVGFGHTEPPLSEVGRGTSETTRDATLKTPNLNFREYKKVQVEHITGLDKDFLTWVIGFIEGDGSFMARDANVTLGTQFHFEPRTQRGEFEVVQTVENLPLLTKMRTKLGFGRVTTFEKNGHQYCRWYTSERENIIRLMCLLNGNLVLEKRRAQFRQWFLHLKAAWALKLVYKESTCNVSLENAWLSGFSDADAGFATNATRSLRGHTRPKGGHYYRFQPKFYITQRGELSVLKRIKDLLGATNKIYEITNGRSPTKYNRMEVLSEESLDKAVAYFSRFPLKGIRRIDALRWARVYGYKKQHRSLGEVSAEELKNVVDNLPDPGEHVKLKQYASDFTRHELEILKRLPMTAYHPDLQKRARALPPPP